jgi:hypothetical protein
MADMTPSFLNRFRGSPMLPALLSGLIAPGIGQWVNGERQKAVVLLAASVGGFVWFTKLMTAKVASVLSIPPEQWAENRTMIQDAVTQIFTQQPEYYRFYTIMFLLWAYSVIDAYLSARHRRLPANEPPTPPDDEASA